MDVLVALGTSAAFFYSAYLGWEWLRDPVGIPDLYFEAAAVIITLIVLGKLFEAIAKGRTSQAIRKLLSLQAKTALVVQNGEVLKCRSNKSSQAISSRRTREKIPVDGVLIEGRSAVD